MGATKLKIKHIASINAEDLAVLGFELRPNMACSYLVNEELQKGEVVLIKASFKDACEATEEQDDNLLFRRRVVPFVTRVRKALRRQKDQNVRVTAIIERMTDEDRNYFFDKYFHQEDEANPLELDLEGKRIRFCSAV